MPDTLPSAQIAADSAKQVYDTTYNVVHGKTNDHAAASSEAARAAREHISNWFADALSRSGAIAYGVNSIATIFDAITKAKISNRKDFDSLVASVTSDLFQVEVHPTSPLPGSGSDAIRAANQALGDAFIGQLEHFFVPSGTVTNDTGENAARNFVGFGMNFAVTAAFMSILPEVLSLGHLKDWAEIGEELQRSLGLGRLNRMALAPLMRNTIQQPYDRKLRAKYRQDMLGVHELIKAIFRGGPLSAHARDLLAQHGLPEDQINELTDQLRPHLTESELDTLVFQGEMTQPEAEAHIQSAGVPPQISQKRFRAITLQRLARLQEAGIGEVLALFRDGKVTRATFNAALDTFDIPLLERKLWGARADVYEGVRRKELSKGDVAFLYEHNQFTLDELQTWLDEEGYDQHDQLALTVEMVQRKTDLQAKQAAASSLKPKALHNQRVAFVTREWQSIFGTPIPPDRLTYYVGLLDSGERTRTDVTAELKQLAGK